jgi:heat shock protein HslJ
VKRIPVSAVALLLAAGAVLLLWRGQSGDRPPPPRLAPNALPAGSADDHRNAQYSIDGRPVKLVDGQSEVTAVPGSAARIVTRYFGNEMRHDLNGDGQDDVVFLLTQETGGTGIFYYVVAALSTEHGYVGSQGVFLGDRIAPQTTEIRPNDIIVVNYADRTPGEGYATRPSVGKSRWLKLDPATLQFGEVAQDFEGEADPARMTLEMTSWTWIRANRGDGTEIVPNQAGAFTLNFHPDGVFTATTDCNRVTGRFVARDHGLTFGDMAATQRFCEGSQQRAFTALLADASGYTFTSRGELVLALKSDGGSVTFR